MAAAIIQHFFARCFIEWARIREKIVEMHLICAQCSTKKRIKTAPALNVWHRAPNHSFIKAKMLKFTFSWWKKYVKFYFMTFNYVLIQRHTYKASQVSSARYLLFIAYTRTQYGQRTPHTFSCTHVYMCGDEQQRNQQTLMYASLCMRLYLRSFVNVCVCLWLENFIPMT